MGILRILLALAVLIEHSGLSLHGIAVPGSIAVEAFFIISGFYIAMILDRKYQFPGGTRLFYQQRYLRLAPMYWFAILSTLAAGAFYGLLGHHPAGKYVIWAQEGAHLTPGAIAALCLSQITMLGQDAVMFFCLSGHPLALHFTPHWMTEPLPAIRFMLVPPAWSISVEILFYLSAPFLVRRSVRFQLTLVAITLTMRALSIIHWGLAYDPWNARFFPFEGGLFLLGSVAYRLLPRAESIMRSRRSLRPAITAVTTAAILMYAWVPLPEGVRHWGFLGLIAVSVPLLFAATQRDPVDRWIAEMSYPLYLLHQVTLYSAEPLFRRISGIPLQIAVIVLPLASAALVYALIERPFEAWRARRYERSVAASKLPAPSDLKIPENVEPIPGS